MNILHAGYKSPVQRDFIKNSKRDLLSTLRILTRLLNFCNFVVIFSLMQLTMICTRVAGFADLEMMNTAQKKED